MESINLMFSELEQVPRMEHPLAARFMAIARPMPRDAPVMTATFPARSCSLSVVEAIIVSVDDVLFTLIEMKNSCSN